MRSKAHKRPAQGTETKNWKTKNKNRLVQKKRCRQKSVKAFGMLRRHRSPCLAVTVTLRSWLEGSTRTFRGCRDGRRALRGGDCRPATGSRHRAPSPWRTGQIRAQRRAVVYRAGRRSGHGTQTFRPTQPARRQPQPYWQPAEKLHPLISRLHRYRFHPRPPSAPFISVVGKSQRTLYIHRNKFI